MMTDKKQNRIICWHGLLSKHDLSDYQEELGQLKRGETKSLKLKKHKNNNDIWVLRTNKKHRIIFKRQKFKDKYILVVVSILKTHKYNTVNYKAEIDYSECRFLNLVTPDEHEITEDDFVDVDNIDDLFQEDVTEEPESEPFVEFFNGQFFVLDSFQKEGVGALLPSILGGPPGTGKTLVAISIITQRIEAGLDDDDVIWYVALEKPLVSSVMRTFTQTPSAQKVKPGQVLFLTYDEKFEKLHAVKNMQEVGAQDCKNWLQSYINATRNLDENKNLSADFWKKSHLFYEEFRVIAGCTQSQYLTPEESKAKGNDVGKKQSCFSACKERLFLYKGFQQYKERLSHANSQTPGKTLYHSDFEPTQHNDQFALIIADEYGDFSRKQAENLLKMAKNKQVCFIGDNNQVTNASRSTVSSLLASFPREKGVERYIELPFSYRSSEAVFNFYSRIKILNDSLANGKELKKGYSEITLSVAQQENPGEVNWYTTDEFKKMPKPAASPNWAVITLPQYVDEATKAFTRDDDEGMVLVFTIAEAKGQEFDDIWLYNIFDLPSFAEISKEVALRDPSSLTKKNRSKNGAESNKYRRTLNELFTAASRPRLKLCVVQGTKINLNPLKNYLLPEKSPTAVKKQDVPQAITTTTTTTTTAKPATLTAEEERLTWYKKADDLIDKNLLKQAAGIFRFLKDNNFEAYSRKRQGIVEEPKAIPPQSTAKKAVMTKPVTPVQSIGTEHEIYVSKAFNNLTETNLIKIFDYKDALYYLFEVRCETSESLFTRIAFNSKKQLVLQEFIKKYPEKAEKITGTYLSREIKAGKNKGLEPLLFMFMNKGTRDLFSTLITANPSVCKGLNFNFSGRLDPTKKRYFDWLTLLKTQDTKDIINKIIDNYPYVFKEFSLESLLQPDPQGIPLIYELVQLHPGIKFVIAILEQNPEHIATVMKDFYKIYSNKDGKYSLFHYFSRSKLGNAFYLKRLNNKEACLEHLTSELFLGDPKQSMLKTLLINLAFFNHGSLVLEQLLAQKPDLLRRLEAAHLFTPMGGEGKIEYTLFDLLCLLKQNHTILQIILKAKPHLINKIDYSMLMSNRCEIINTLPGMKPLHHLLLSAPGLSIVNQAFNVGQKWLGRFTAKDLCELLTIPEEDRKFSLFNQFNETEEGKILLNMIFRVTPYLFNQTIETQRDYIKAAEAEKSLAKLSASKGVSSNADIKNKPSQNVRESTEQNVLRSSRVYTTEEFMAKTDELFADPPMGQSVTHVKPTLFEDVPSNELFNAMSGKKLFIPYKHKADNKRYHSFIIYICADVNRTNAFVYYLDKNPDKVKALTAKLLCRAFTENKGIIPLSFFLTTGNGLRILQKILQLNKKLVEQITLPQATYVGEFSIYNHPLHAMLAFKTGCELLEEWCTYNPAMVNGIGYKKLMERPASGYSLFYILTAPGINRIILTEILNKNKSIYSQITLRDLLPPSEQSCDFPLVRLSSDRNGCTVIYAIFELQPSLYQQLKVEMLFALFTNKVDNSALAGANLFFNLARNNPKFLIKFGKYQPEFLTSITTKVLSEQARHCSNKSAFQCLMENVEDGHIFLQQLVLANSKLPSQLFEQFKPKLALKVFLCSFFANKDGIDLLSCFVKKDEVFCDALQLDHWDIVYNNQSLVSRLWADLLGQEIWSYWVDKKTVRFTVSEERDAFLQQAAIVSMNAWQTDSIAQGWFEIPFMGYPNLVGFFMADSNRTNLFIQNLKNNTHYKKGMSGRYLSRPITDGKHKGYAPLQFLLGSVTGIKILEAFLTLNKEWIKELTFSHLRAVGPDNTLCMPLHFMLRKKAGLDLCNNIITSWPAAFADLKEEILLSGDAVHDPLLVMLATDVRFNKLLENIVYGNQELLHAHTEFLLLRLWKFPEMPGLQSLFFSLSCFNHPELCEWVTDAFLSQINKELLIDRIQVNEGETNGFTALSTSTTGVEILCQIFALQPDIERYFAEEGLCAELEHKEGMTTLFNLMIDENNGRVMFINFLNINPDLPSQLLQKTDVLNQNDISQFNVLAIILHTQGIELFKRFLKCDKAFANSITRKRLQSRMFKHEDNKETVLEQLRAAQDQEIDAWLQTIPLESSELAKVPCTILSYSKNNLFSLPTLASNHVASDVVPNPSEWDAAAVEWKG